MKGTVVGIAIFAATIFSNVAMAQRKTEEQEITKKVEMKEENGEKVLTIKTKANGMETEEVYKGEAAEKKLAELQSGEMENQVKEEIQVEDHNGVITLTINRTENGVTTTEVLKGEEAEKRLKEMGVTQPETKQPKHKKIVEEKNIEINHD
jgi:hypothetical protein